MLRGYYSNYYSAGMTSGTAVAFGQPVYPLTATTSTTAVNGAGR